MVETKQTKTTWRRTGRIAGALAVGLLVCYAFVAWFVAGKLSTPAYRRVGPPPDDLMAETVTLESKSGSDIAAWVVTDKDSTATVILAHGIRGDRRANLERARLFHEAGFSIVMIDLQAHGESTPRDPLAGQQITFGYLERHDIAAAVAYVRKHHPDHRIGIVGVSLGGAATALAAPLDVDAVVLESTYATIDEAVHNRVACDLGPASYAVTPTLLCQLRPRLGIPTSQLRPIDKLPLLNCPVMIASGDTDPHTPLAETQRMFSAAKEPKELVTFEGAEHEDLLAHNPKKYRREVLPFLEKYLRSVGK
jgi:pimeloyl-ACP methyl ester carboxylesterase